MTILNKYWGYLLRVVLLACIAFAARYAIARKKTQIAQVPRYQAPARLVKTAQAKKGDFVKAHQYLAEVEPLQSANIVAQVTARIEDIAVREGDVVSAGQTLLTLDHRQIDAQIQTALAQVKQAEAELEANLATIKSLERTLDYWRKEAARDAELAEKKVTPKATLEATLEKRNEAEGRLTAARRNTEVIKQRVAAAQARQEELRVARSYCVLASAFSGVVTSRRVDPGDQAAPGKVLLVVEGKGPMRVAFNMPQSDLAEVTAGNDLSFSTNSEVVRTVISRVYPSLNRARMARVEADLSAEKAKGLSSGEYLTVNVTWKLVKNACLIPVDALMEGGTLEPHVFVVNDGHLESRKVNVLGTACEQAAVEGVAPGEDVVVHSFLGWAQLATGMRVEARQ